ncbi:LysR family transcriptional regulator [Burkholderia gladioli]|uniref:LysR family transcriptional regulator n=1 Tax=Burkholderia gladioli TaxID=28095 RepID=UPI00163FBB1E|nr:LysR family transcriptional regulator [Burkholderia gladioli]
MQGCRRVLFGMARTPTGPENTATAELEYKSAEVRQNKKVIFVYDLYFQKQMDWIVSTFKQVEAFVALADTGSISAAARALGIAQSGASTQVSNFEALFPRPLLDRSGRCPSPTVDGEEVLMRARSLLARRDAFLFALSSKALPIRQLRLGVTEVVALTWLNAFLQALRTEFPMAEVKLEVGVSAQLREALRSGELDAVVVPDASSNHGFVETRLGSIENRWYCSPALHPGAKTLRLKDLSRFDLLSRGSLSRSGVRLEDWLRDNGIAPRSVISSSSLLAVLDLMVSGLGIAHLPEPLVRELLARDLAVELRVRPRIPPVDYLLLFREGGSTQMHKRLIEIAAEACDFSASSKGALIGSGQPRRERAR